MVEEEKTLGRLYVASPCSADWDDMPGNDQVRFCNQCQFNVYNISAMTRIQAEGLIAKTEGRLCTNLQLNLTLQVGTTGGAAFLPGNFERGNGRTSKFTQRV
jgi:hypothetical protein